MRLTIVGLTTALVLTNALAFAQGASGMTMGPSGSIGAPSTTIAGSENAGGITAGANSALNPSGNSFINTSPSGSTLGPTSLSGR